MISFWKNASQATSGSGSSMNANTQVAAPLSASDHSVRRPNFMRWLFSCEAVPVELPALHDRGQLRAAVVKHTEVLERITVDHQQVGVGALLQHAELALAADHLGRNRGRGLDDLPGLHHLAADLELDRLV